MSLLRWLIQKFRGGNHRQAPAAMVAAKASMGMKVIRADGTVEDYGTQFEGQPVMIPRQMAADMGMEV